MRRVGMAIAAVFAAAAVTLGPLIALDIAVVLIVGSLLTHDLRRARAARARDSELRAAVALLESELEAGTPPQLALAAAAADSPLLSRALGPPDEIAARGIAALEPLVGSDDPDLRRLGVSWRLGEATGIPLAEVLGKLGDDLRSSTEQQRAVSVALAGAQSSAALLAGLPALGIALGAGMGARPLPLLFESHAGRLLCCAGVLLDAAGILWVRRIVQRAQQ